jgi:hypothetical protein
LEQEAVSQEEGEAEAAAAAAAVKEATAGVSLVVPVVLLPVLRVPVAPLASCRPAIHVFSKRRLHAFSCRIRQLLTTSPVRSLGQDQGEGEEGEENPVAVVSRLVPPTRVHSSSELPSSERLLLLLLLLLLPGICEGASPRVQFGDDMSARRADDDGDSDGGDEHGAPLVRVLEGGM